VRYVTVGSPVIVSSMMPYERFTAWKAAHRLALEIYEVTERWPRNERFALPAVLSSPFQPRSIHPE